MQFSIVFMPSFYSAGAGVRKKFSEIFLLYIARGCARVILSEIFQKFKLLFVKFENFPKSCYNYNRMKKGVISMSKEKYAHYDEVVNTIMMNVLVERQRCGRYLLWDFNPNCDSDRLYFNITAIAADLNREFIWLNMPFIDYIKFKKKRHKTRKNLRYFGPIRQYKLKEENKTSIYMIMDFICEKLNISHELLKEINDEYYGWYE